MPRISITDEYSLVKRKGSDNWYLEWRDRGEKFRRSTGTGCADAARVRARELILAGVQIRDAEPTEISIADILDRYRLQRGEKLAGTDVMRRAVAIWKEWWKGRAVSDATIGAQEDFVAWLRGKRYSEGYVRRVLGVGKAAMNRAWKRGEVRQVPFVELPPITDAYPHYATRKQIVALLNADMPEHIRVYVMIRLCTGCRGDAALDLQPFQIDRDAQLIRLNPPGRQQTKKYRAVVPLCDTLANVLAATDAAAHYVNWHGQKVACIKTTWRKIRAKAGLPVWFAPKVLRHTVATELRRRGVPDWEASGLLGHRKGGTTEIYAKFSPDYLGKARMAIDEWMRDLARDVPALRGVSAGSVASASDPSLSLGTRAVAGLRVVGATGIEPVTPTMSRYRKSSKIND